jgi:hypothetical protein
MSVLTDSGIMQLMAVHLMSLHIQGKSVLRRLALDLGLDRNLTFWEQPTINAFFFPQMIVTIL